jgi:hypothetical protein
LAAVPESTAVSSAPFAKRSVPSRLANPHEVRGLCICQGKGKTIVLLSDGTLSVGYLDGLADALARAGYRVVGR